MKAIQMSCLSFLSFSYYDTFLNKLINLATVSHNPFVAKDDHTFNNNDSSCEITVLGDTSDMDQHRSEHVTCISPFHSLNNKVNTLF